MTRHKNETNDTISAAAKQRETEMQPTPVVTRRFDADNPVETEGTTEVPREFASDSETSIRQRFEAMEKQKDKDIETLKKQRDGKAQV